MSYDRNTAISFVEVLRELAQQRGSDAAFHFLRETEIVSTISYAYLDETARGIAAELQHRGLAGKSALLIFAPGREFITALMGCFYAGVTAVPSFPPRPGKQSARLMQIASDAHPAIGLTSSDVLATCAKNSSGYSLVPWLDWLVTDTLSLMPGAWDDAAIGPSHLAFIQYTSGSTAIPKGVMLTHQNLISNSRAIEYGFGHSMDTVGLVWLPPYHDMGLIGGILQPIYAGFPCYLMQPMEFLRSPINWLRSVSRYGVTTSGGPNFSYEMSISRTTEEERLGLDLGRWTLAFNGAEPVRCETMHRFSETFRPYGFKESAFFPCYGLAEATLFVSGSVPSQGANIIPVSSKGLEKNTIASPEDIADRHLLVSAGVPAQGVEVRIVDPQTHIACVGEQIGEIWTRSAGNALGYWGQTQESKHVFDGTVAGESGYLRTGDQGFLSQNHLFVTGRIKDMIILNGRNLYPQDIEWTVGMVDSRLGRGIGAVFGIEIEGSERVVVVHELVGAGIPNDVDQLIAKIRSTLVEEHSIQPHGIVFVRRGSLPITTSGKVRRHACKRSYLEGKLQSIHLWDESVLHSIADMPSRLPETPLEAMMLQMAIDILGRKDITVTANFLSLGAHSLALAKFISQLSDLLGREISLSLAFENPTIEELAAFISLNYPLPDGQQKLLESLMAGIDSVEPAS